MKKAFYLFNPGRMSRKDNSLKFVARDEEGNEKKARNIPIEGVEKLLVFGELDGNSSLYNFLGKQKIPVHFFDYYEHYTGSFMPKDYLLAGKMVVSQTQHYMDARKRMVVARRFIVGAAFNMLKNLKYYHNRGKDLANEIALIEEYSKGIETAETVQQLMGIEGNIRQVYYQGFDIIIDHFTMGNRSKRPPKNEVNALISFCNMLIYTAVLDAIYHTQLNPTISFLHEPGTRRYSLALDIAEIFKPIIADRLIFKLLNKRVLQKGDFSAELNRCLLKEKGKKKLLKSYEERLQETIQHRSLKKKVSYKHLIKLECYKLSKHLLGMEEYRPFKIWW